MILSQRLKLLFSFLSIAILTGIVYLLFALMIAMIAKILTPILPASAMNAIGNQMESLLPFILGFAFFIAIFMFFGIKKRFRGSKDKVIKGSSTLEGKSAKQAARSLTKGNDGVRLHNSYVMSKTQEKNHTLIVAGTGGGKGIILTQLLLDLYSKGRKTLAYDIKGDYSSMYATEPGVTILSPFDERSAEWDISSDITNRMTAEEFAHLLVAASSRGGGDSIFPEAARDVISVVLYGLIREKKDNGRPWGIRDLINILSDEKATTEYCRKYDPGALQSIPENAEKQRAGTFGNIRAACRMLKYLGQAWPNSENTSFSVTSWLQDPQEKLLLLQGSPRYEALSSFFTSLVYSIAGGKILSLNDDSERDVWFLIDEMGTLPKMRSLLSVLKLGRSRGLRIVAAIQDFGAINEKYGKESETILGNFGTQLAGRVNDPQTAQWLSELFGKRQVERTTVSKNAGTSGSFLGGRQSDSNSQSISKSLIIEDALLDSHFLGIPQANPSRGIPAMMWIRTSGESAIKLEWMPISIARSQPENIPAKWLDD